MLNQKNISLKLFLATLLVVVGINTDSNNYISELNIGDRLLAQEVESKFKFAAPNDELIVKKSGGRSGGGSFKSRSSGSRSSRSSSPSRNSTRTKSYSSPSRNSTKTRSYSSPSRNSTRTYDTYDSSPYYSDRSSDRYSTVIFIGIIIFLIFWSIFSKLFSSSTENRRTENQITQERDNDKVTISKLQIALSTQARGLQTELSELSLRVATDTDAGLLELVRESVLLLLRNSAAWTHVCSDSTSLHIDRAESTFDQISLVERSKFTRETISNVDGTIRTRENQSADDDRELPAYVVVTLILGTADDQPLFEKIQTESQLNAALQKLAAIRADYLMKVELLWTPQTEDEYLTDEELLLEYTNMMPLV